MSITALFATTGATNAGLYPAIGVSDHLAETGQFPTVMGSRLAGRVPVGLLVAAVLVVVQVILFDLSAIASIGSAVALMIFLLVTAGHLRIRSATGARLSILVLAVLTAGVTLVTFALTTLIQEPTSITTLAIILGASIALDVIWSRIRAGRDAAVA
jgi:L-asparagine transporter-like permease